uniref:Uncharacterized protein n=1 Tax=Oryza glumipatula TaxID=40148 RepID=A0A0E0BK00_9ORYZ
MPRDLSRSPPPRRRRRRSPSPPRYHRGVRRACRDRSPSRGSRSPALHLPQDGALVVLHLPGDIKVGLHRKDTTEEREVGVSLALRLPNLKVLLLRVGQQRIRILLISKG